jgi:hypothetical protein
MVSAGVALGMDRHCRAVVISAAPGALSGNHRHIFIVARIKPAPEIRRGLFESDNTL